MNINNKVTPLFKELVNFIPEKPKKTKVISESKTVVTISGQEIPTNRAYQIIKKGKFVGWGSL